MSKPWWKLLESATLWEHFRICHTKPLSALLLGLNFFVWPENSKWYLFLRYRCSLIQEPALEEAEIKVLPPRRKRIITGRKESVERGMIQSDWAYLRRIRDAKRKGVDQGRPAGTRVDKGSHIAQRLSVSLQVARIPTSEDLSFCVVLKVKGR